MIAHRTFCTCEISSNWISECARSIPGGRELDDGERRDCDEAARGDGGDAGEEGGRAPPVCRGQARGDRKAAGRGRSKRGQAKHFIHNQILFKTAPTS